MKAPHSVLTIEAARARLFAADPKEKWTLELLEAGNTMMKACEDSQKVTFEDMLRCLDFPGAVAEFGARCLYVRTGRDGVGWKPALAEGLPFSTAKDDWIAYLKKRKLIT